jgi:alginate O-acetyltransferase complex protein AlgI
MNFISKEFAVLLVSVLIFLYLFKNPLARKLTVLSASCVFYAWWDWRFLGLLATVTLVDYYVSHFLFTAKSEKKRKILLWVSIVTNLGFLGVFKYFNFFTQTLDLLAQTWGWRVGTLNIILPIGISFYTFETLSYVIDVYRRVTLPAKSLLDYAIFITFFPRLVAGPIMRASQFLPQLERGIQLNFPGLVNGAQLFLRGMLKKMVIADNVAVMVDQVFQAPGVFSSPTVWLGVAAYSVQILYDFWGYTDMACGIGKMLGIELPINFNLPYTAQSISEFWTRWHISLSTWLRDYLYISLGGNRRGKVRTYLNLMITMLLGGLVIPGGRTHAPGAKNQTTFMALSHRLGARLAGFWIGNPHLGSISFTQLADNLDHLSKAVLYGKPVQHRMVLRLGAHRHPAGHWRRVPCPAF